MTKSKQILFRGARAFMRKYSNYARSLISLLIFASLILGLSQGVREASPGQPVVGEITLHSGPNPNVAITAPIDISGWNLVPGEVNQRTGILRVHASGKWNIRVAPDSGSNGRMAECILDQSYPREMLQNSMKIKAKGYDEIDLAQGGILIQNAPAGDFEIPIIFSQMLTWDDQPLPEGHAYCISISFIPTLIQEDL